MMGKQFTDEEIEIAKRVDLVKVAESFGYTPKRVGHYYTLKEMDSIRIYNHSNWFRWSKQYDRGENGGTQIDFLKVFAGLSIKDSISWLLDFAGYWRSEKDSKAQELKHQIQTVEELPEKAFVLPPMAENNARLYSYLTHERCLGKKVINYFVIHDLVYESSPYHNIVFKGKDADGVTRFASMRGVYDRKGKPFKCDVAGNNKHYGVNVVHEDSTELNVFEAAIDLMSYMDMYNDFETNMLALGMLSDAPLETFLKEHAQIRKIRFCLDNDSPGREAAKHLTEKYARLGYETEDCPPPEKYKDYNEWLVSVKHELTHRNAVQKKDPRQEEAEENRICDNKVIAK